MNKMERAIAERKEAGEPEEAADLGVFKMDDEPIPPRGWLLGNVFSRATPTSYLQPPISVTARCGP